MAASHKCRPLTAEGHGSKNCSSPRASDISMSAERAAIKAIQIEAFGNPAEVVKAVDIPDVGAPAAAEVVIAVEASPINQYDLLMIASSYGYRPRLPAITGSSTHLRRRDQLPGVDDN